MCIVGLDDFNCGMESLLKPMQESMTKKELWSAYIHLQKQISKLGRCILEKYPKEEINTSACNVAINILRR